MENVRSNKRGNAELKKMPDSYNVNMLMQTGLYDVKNPTNGLLDLPRVRLQVVATGNDAITQIIYADKDDDRNMIFTRTFNGSIWSAWDRMLSEGNVSDHISSVINFESNIPELSAYGMNVQVTDPTDVGAEPRTFEYDNIKIEITGSADND